MMPETAAHNSLKEIVYLVLYLDQCLGSLDPVWRNIQCFPPHNQKLEALRIIYE